MTELMCDEYEHLVLSINDFKSLMESIISYNTQNNDKSHVLDQNIVQSIINTIKCCEEVLENSKIYANAEVFDVECIRANGYRSTHMIVDCAINHMFLALKDANMKYMSRKRYYAGHLTQIVQYEDFWKILVTLTDYIGQAYVFAVENDSKSLFMPRNEQFNKIMFSQKDFLHPILYEKFVAFQYVKSIRSNLSLVLTAMASYYDGFTKHRNKWRRMFTSLASGTMMAFSSEERAKRVFILLSNPCIEFCKIFWSLNSTYNLQNITSIFLPKVSVNKNIIIKKNVTLSVPTDDNSICGTEKTINFEDLFASCTVNKSFKQTQQISVRVLSYTGQPSESLVFYIHGGGFLSQSTDECLVFLKQWARDLKVPVVSVDYTHSPEAMFPEALYECFLAYCFVLTHTALVNSNCSRMALIGDSAGGTLVCSLAQLIIRENIRKPSGLVCLYPVVNMQAIISPSRLLSVFDYGISCEVLKLCLCSYLVKDFWYFRKGTEISPNSSGFVSDRSDRNLYSINNSYNGLKKSSHSLPSSESNLHEQFIECNVIEGSRFSSYSNDLGSMITNLHAASIYEMCDPAPYLLSDELYQKGNDPLVSPIYTDAMTLSKFPTTYIVISDTDPLLDECIEFYRLLRNAKVNTHIEIMHGLPHGFLHFGAATGGIRDSYNKITKLLGSIVCEEVVTVTETASYQELKTGK